MKRSKKVILIITGTLCVLLAILGALLPLLPTTPFLLLASACYLRGSERLYHRLMSSRFFGSYLKNLHERKMPFRAKIYTLVTLWASLLFSIYKFDNLMIDVLLFTIGLIVTFVILSFKPATHSMSRTRTR